MSRLRLIAGLALATLLAPQALAQPTAILADRIHPVGGEPIEGGTILIEDGKIKAIGRDVEVPAGARKVRAKVVIPGLVGGYSLLAGNLGGGAFDASRRALVDYDLYAERRRALAGGVTSAYLAASGRLVGGQGAVVRFGGPPAQRALRASASLELDLGLTGLNPPGEFNFIMRPAPERPYRPMTRGYPATRMGQLAALRALFTRAKQANGKGGPQLAPWKAALAGELPLLVRADKASDIVRALRLAEEFGVKLTIVGGAEAWRLAETLAARKVPVILDALGAAASGDRFADPRARDEGQARVDAAALLSRAGVTVSIASAQPGREGELLFNAALAIRAGLGERAALAAITLGPARALGLEKQIGQLTVGADADLLLLSGEPFAAGSRIEQTWIRGQACYRHRSRGAAPAAPLPLATQLTCIKAGKVLTVSGGELVPGIVLIGRGKILAVGGPELAIPAGAKLIELPDAVLSPGLIDAYSHLGVTQRTIPGVSGRRPLAAALAGLGVPFDLAVRPADPALARALRAGLTSALLGPDNTSPQGGGALIKTAPRKAQDKPPVLRVLARHAALVLSATGRGRQGAHRPDLQGTIERRLNAGLAYHKKWVKYAEDKKKGKKDEPAKIVVVKKDDPISGTWEAYLVFRGRRVQRLVIELKLEGTKVSGTLRGGGQSTPFEGGSWDPKTKTLKFKVSSPRGMLPITLELVDADVLEGNISLGRMTLGLQAERTSKSGGGSSLRRDSNRPKVSRPLEPYRALFEGKSGAIVHAGSSDELGAALQALEPHKVKRVGVVADRGFGLLADQLQAHGVTVVLGPFTGDLAAGLHQRGVPLALGSFAYDRADQLPLIGAELTRRGLPADAALRALTLTPARLLGVADRLGSIAPGRDADLVLWSGHPMAPASRPLLVMIDGEIVVDRRGEKR